MPHPSPDTAQPTTAPTRPAPARDRIVALDGLRGVAALLVVLYHIRPELARLPLPRWVFDFLHGAGVMVDIFFVLSGFVLARLMLRAETWGDARRFIERRVRRFFPLHLTALAISFLTLAVIIATYVHRGAAEANWPSWVERNSTPWAWLSSLFLLQGWVGPDRAGYSPAWSLSVELWLNVAFIIVMVLAAKIRARWLVGAAFAAAGVALLLSVSYKTSNTVGATGVGRGLAGLGLGVVMYQLYVRYRDRALRWAGLGAVIAIVALVDLVLSATFVFRHQYLPVTVVAAIAVFMLAVPATGPMHAVFSTPVMRWLGSRSFALYALHMPVIVALRALGIVLHTPRATWLMWVTGLGVPIFALVAADLGHRYVERRWERRPAVVTRPAEHPMMEQLDSIVVFVPRAHSEHVLEALLGFETVDGSRPHRAFVSEGRAAVSPVRDGDGDPGVTPPLPEPEDRVEVTYPRYRRNEVVAAMLAAHPSQEPVFHVVEHATVL